MPVQKFCNSLRRTPKVLKLGTPWLRWVETGSTACLQTVAVDLQLYVRPLAWEVRPFLVMEKCLFPRADQF